MSIEIDILSGAIEVEPEWWDLWRRDPAATPFQSPAWLLPWRQAFDSGESRVLTVRKGGMLQGIVPLFRHESRLLLWGAGTSDWLDGVFDPTLDTSELAAALAALEEPLDLFQLRAGSPLLTAPMPPGWAEIQGFSEPCARLGLPARLSANMAQKLRYYRRRAERAGASASQAAAGSFDELADLHRRRWSGKGERGVLSDPRVGDWHRMALPLLASAGLLRFYVIRLDGKVVAALYALAAKGTAFYYIAGFDPDHAGLGLGTVLVGHAIAEAEREGARCFDFLRGQEAYKYRWGASDCPTLARQLRPPKTCAGGLSPRADSPRQPDCRNQSRASEL